MFQSYFLIKLIKKTKRINDHFAIKNQTELF